MHPSAPQLPAVWHTFLIFTEEIVIRIIIIVNIFATVKIITKYRNILRLHVFPLLQVDLRGSIYSFKV